MSLDINAFIKEDTMRHRSNRTGCVRRYLGKSIVIAVVFIGIRHLWTSIFLSQKATVLELGPPKDVPILLLSLLANDTLFMSTDQQFIHTIETDNDAHADEGGRNLGSARLGEISNSASDMSHNWHGDVPVVDPLYVNSETNNNQIKAPAVLTATNVVQNVAGNNANFDNDNKDKTVSKSKPLIKNLESDSLTGVCDLVIPWGQSYQAQHSTYDLLQLVNYTTDVSGRYPIPTRTFKEIEKTTETSEKLSVILVPFSHADPGYGLTMEQYYKSKTKQTLDLMIEKLTQYPNMTFQWAETVFLARWFMDLNEESKANVRALIHREQLEIVLGGWVMPDEASTTITSVVDQLIEGHQWLHEHLGVSPKSAWVNDPFGYSSTMPYLWKSAGMENLMFLRINQPLKAKLMEMKSLEFSWRPYWERTNSSDILAGLMPYTNYWVDDMCGPDPRICSKFNYLHLGEKNRHAVQVTPNNVEKLATELYQQFRITGDLFKYQSLYIGLGEDFSYTKAKHWDAMYLNYEQLIKYINSKKDWNMTIKFGTLSEYFDNVRKEEHRMKVKVKDGPFPTLSGDFFPYTDRRGEFWTGYFTTRPLNKRFSREIESLLRAADIFNVIVHSIFKYYRVTNEGSGEITESLRIARRELGMFMHHDGITGTSLPHVVRDFESRLYKANTMANNAMKSILVSLLSRGKLHTDKLLTEEYVKPGMRKMAEKRVIETAKVVKVILANPTSKRRTEVVELFVTSGHFTLSSPTVSDIKFQVRENVASHGQVHNIVSFVIDLPAFAIEMYTLVPMKHKPRTEHVAKAINTEPTDTIENMHMKVEFDKDSGILRRITDVHGRETNITMNFCVWKAPIGGAYIISPNSDAMTFSTGKKTVTVTKGPFVSEIKIVSQGFVQRIKLYNTTGIQGHGIHVSNEVDMATVGMKEMDVGLQIQTGVQNGLNFYTDQNNFQFMGRKADLNSAYFPMTGMIFIEDNERRLTIHSKQAHGVTSVDGLVEIMLDRHTFRDDGRGLGQGVYDNVNVNSDFVIHIEHKQHPFTPIEERYTYATEDAVLMNDFFQNNVIMYTLTDINTKFINKVHPLKKSELPCDTTIVGMRNIVRENLDYNSTSLVLHRRSFHCGFKPQNNQCPTSDKTVTIRNLFPKLKVKVTETSLSLLKEKRTLTLDSDIRPRKNELRALKIQI